MDALSIYSAGWSKYEAFCGETKRILETSFASASIPFHTIEARAKSIESFRLKAQKLGTDGKPKYADPLTDITDLAAVRIITYTLADVERVSRFISGNFEVVEKTDVGEKRFEEGKFGYQSIHFLIRYSAARANLPDVAQYARMICEVQVRTILQHAWAEIEHDVQYKNQSGLPTSLQRKFIALAGLLEIADREFQSIQDQDEALKRTVIESLQEDLTRVAIAEPPNSAVGETVPPQSVRHLIKQSRYEDAVKIYDAKIASTPTMHTLFIGRAKARFLSGDRAGAMSDIEQASSLNPDDPAIAVLRQQVQEGSAANTALQLSSESIAEAVKVANELTRQGNEAVRSGDGAAAFSYYSDAQEYGASRPFNLVNKAIACIVAGDVDGAKIQLSSLEVRIGTPFSVAILALYCVVYALGEPSRFEEEFTRMRLALLACENFELSLSPLPRLRAGMAKSGVYLDGTAKGQIDKVFKQLEAAPTAQVH